MYLVQDWQYEVANGDTRLGYNEWVEHKREADQPKLVQTDGWQSDGRIA